MHMRESVAHFHCESEWTHILLFISTPSIFQKILWYPFSLELNSISIYIYAKISFLPQAGCRRIKMKTCVAGGNVNPWYWWTSVGNNILEGLLKWKIFGKTGHRVEKTERDKEEKGGGWKMEIAEETEGFKSWVIRLLKFM